MNNRKLKKIIKNKFKGQYIKVRDSYWFNDKYIIEFRTLSYGFKYKVAVIKSMLNKKEYTDRLFKRIEYLKDKEVVQNFNKDITIR